MKIYTAQMSKIGECINPIDITVKSGDKVFAPTWKMVMDYKAGLITEAEYTRQYRQMMYKSTAENTARWEEVFAMDEVTFVCYCPKGAFCHRHVLASMFQDIARDYKSGGVEIVPE
jgi:uncharacterized protein YeaO (DUF488 family)